MLVFVLLSGLLVGCATFQAPQIQDRMQQHPGWTAATVKAGAFRLMGASTPAQAGGVKLLYIEGDGQAFITRSQVSGNPTPVGFSALDLAFAGPVKHTAYLARPCQWTDFADQPACVPEVWSSGRFMPPALAAMDAGFRQVTGTGPVVIVGYSGGAVFALELAKRHPNVVAVVTVAGNLSPDATNRWHKVSQVDGELDPLAAPRRLAEIPVVHLVGTEDRIITPGLTRQVLAGAPALACQRVIEIPGIGHADGWAEWWQGHAGSMFSGLTAGGLGCDKPRVP